MNQDKVVEANFSSKETAEETSFSAQDIQEKVKFSVEELERLKKKLQGTKEKEDIVTLQECIDIVDNFISGKVTLEELQLFGNKISIRYYVPIMEKLECLMVILTQHDISNVESNEIKTVELYKDIFFTVILGLYGQIQFDRLKDKQLLTYSNYDKLFPLFNSFILSYCKEDYDLLMQMLRDSLSLSGVSQLNDSVGGISIEELKKINESNKQLVQSLEDSKELIRDLKDIQLANDENTKTVVKAIKDMTVREVIEETKGNLEKSQNEVLKRAKNETLEKVKNESSEELKK